MFEERLYFWGLKNKFEKQFEQKLEFSESLKKYRIAALRDSNVASYLLDNDYNYTYLLTNADQNLKMLFFETESAYYGVDMFRPMLKMRWPSRHGRPAAIRS